MPHNPEKARATNSIIHKRGFALASKVSPTNSDKDKAHFTAWQNSTSTIRGRFLAENNFDAWQKDYLEAVDATLTAWNVATPRYPKADKFSRAVMKRLDVGTETERLTRLENLYRSFKAELSGRVERNHKRYTSSTHVYYQPFEIRKDLMVLFVDLLEDVLN